MDVFRELFISIFRTPSLRIMMSDHFRSNMLELPLCSLMKDLCAGLAFYFCGSIHHNQIKIVNRESCRGIEKIERECKAYHVVPPNYDYSMSGLMLTFHANPEHLIAAVGEQEGSKKTPVKTSVKTSVKILQFLEVNPSMTLAEIAGEIGKSLRAIEFASSKLVKENRLRHVGPQKGGHWEVLT